MNRTAHTTRLLSIVPNANPFHVEALMLEHNGGKLGHLSSKDYERAARMAVESMSMHTIDETVRIAEAHGLNRTL